MLPEDEMEIVLAYDALYNRHKLWQKMTWRGYDCAKTPEDMWLYQETIHALKPSLIVEFGTNKGGTALFYADMLDLCGSDGRVISVDVVKHQNRPLHPRLAYLNGHSRHDDIISEIRASASMGGPVLVIEDSEHTGDHVGKELEIYHDIVTPGSWFVVEDLNWPCRPNNVQEVIAEFLKAHPNFRVDASKDKYLMTLAPGGWLKRVR